MADRKKRAIDALDVYANTIKLGKLEYFEFDTQTKEELFKTGVKPDGYYAFTYENPDSLHDTFQLSISGLYPVREAPYYFLDQESFEALVEKQDSIGRKQTTALTISNRRFMMLPSIFYNAIPQGLLYESIAKSPEFEDIDFNRNILGILSVTGASPIGRIHCVETGTIINGGEFKEIDVSTVDKFLMQYYDPDKPKQVNIGALVNVMQNFSRQSGVPGQMPKLMAAINAKSLNIASESDFDGNTGRYSHYSEYIQAYNDKAGQEEELSNANIDIHNERMTGANAVSILKTEKSAVPGVVLNEFICMNGLAMTGSPSAITQISGGGKILISVRFDYLHELGKTGYNRGFEDMASVMGRSITNKGMGFPVKIDTKNRQNPETGEDEIVNLSKTTVTMLDVYNAMEKVVSPGNFNNSRDQLFYSFVYSNFVRNSDNHLRNYGVLYEENDVYLAPTYDVFNTDIYRGSPGYGTLGGVVNRTETLTESLKWLDANEIIKLGQQMKLSASSVKQVIANVRRSLEAAVNEFMEDKSIEHKIFTDPANSVVMIAMARSFEDSIRNIMGRPNYKLKPGPNLTGHYQSYLDKLDSMPLDRLRTEYEESLIKFKPVYLDEVAELLVNKKLLPSKTFWGRSLEFLDDVHSEQYKAMAASQNAINQFEVQRNKDKSYDDEFALLLAGGEEIATPGFAIPDDTWEPSKDPKGAYQEFVKTTETEEVSIKVVEAAKIGKATKI